MHEFFDALVPELCIRSDVDRIRIHDLDSNLLLRDPMYPVENMSDETRATVDSASG